MKYLALDIGTYSIKTVLMKYERRQFFVLDTKEFVLEELKSELDPDGGTASLQRTLIENIVPKDFDGKVIYQVPSQMVTSRHLELPVTQKKKVDMMIPFQLDEILPFPSMDAHFFAQLTKKEKSTSALINVTKRREMADLFNDLERRNALPTILTTELAAHHANALNKNTMGPMAILDIGHRTSKCYIIYEGQVVAHHFSFCAGAAIDEVISQTYQIPNREAVIYKHQNCFLLTEGQYDGVTAEQREFALLMKRTLMPLVHEVKRWLLGFRVQYGAPIDSLYLVGGSTNIHNIGNFFAQQVGVHTDFLSISESLMDPDELLEGSEGTYYLSTLMASTLAEKNKPGNFLTGDFSTGSNLTLPLHSIGFYVNRGMTLFLILGLLLGIDTIVQIGREKKIDRTVKTLIKQKELGLSNAEKRRWEDRLDKISEKLQKKNEIIEQEVKSLMSSTRQDGLAPLTKVFSLVSANKNIELVEFETFEGTVQGAFKSSQPNLLARLQEDFQGAGFQGLKLKIKNTRLEFSFNQN